MLDNLSEEQIAEIVAKALRSAANPHLNDPIRSSAIKLLTVIYDHTTILKTETLSTKMPTPIYDTLRLMKHKWGMPQALKDAMLFLGDCSTELESFIQSDEFFPPIDKERGV